MAKRSSAHQAAQKAGRERDFETCQACGSTHKPEGHHILDFQYSEAKIQVAVQCCLCSDCLVYVWM